MSCLCPDVWDVIASFMPPDGKGEGYYRLALVSKSILMPVLLEKGKEQVRQRLRAEFQAIVNSSFKFMYSVRWHHGQTVRDELARMRRWKTRSHPSNAEFADLRGAIDLMQRDSDTWDVDNGVIALLCWHQHTKKLQWEADMATMEMHYSHFAVHP